MKKALRIIFLVLLGYVFVGFIGYFLFQMFAGVVLRDTYIYVRIPDGRCIAWNEVQKRPENIIDDHEYWFDDLLESDCLEQLSEYMKENNLVIPPGEYHIAGVKRFNKLKRRLFFVKDE